MCRKKNGYFREVETDFIIYRYRSQEDANTPPVTEENTIAESNSKDNDADVCDDNLSEISAPMKQHTRSVGRFRRRISTDPRWIEHIKEPIPRHDVSPQRSVSPDYGTRITDHRQIFQPSGSILILPQRFRCTKPHIGQMSTLVNCSYPPSGSSDNQEVINHDVRSNADRPSKSRETTSVVVNSNNGRKSSLPDRPSPSPTPSKCRTKSSPGDRPSTCQCRNLLSFNRLSSSQDHLSSPNYGPSTSKCSRSSPVDRSSANKVNRLPLTDRPTTSSRSVPTAHKKHRRSSKKKGIIYSMFCRLAARSGFLPPRNERPPISSDAAQSVTDEASTNSSEYIPTPSTSRDVTYNSTDAGRKRKSPMSRNDMDDMDGINCVNRTEFILTPSTSRDMRCNSPETLCNRESLMNRNKVDDTSYTNRTEYIPTSSTSRDMRYDLTEAVCKRKSPVARNDADEINSTNTTEFIPTPSTSRDTSYNSTGRFCKRKRSLDGNDEGGMSYTNKTESTPKPFTSRGITCGSSEADFKQKRPLAINDLDTMTIRYPDDREQTTSASQEDLISPVPKRRRRRRRRRRPKRQTLTDTSSHALDTGDADSSGDEDDLSDGQASSSQYLNGTPSLSKAEYLPGPSDCSTINTEQRSQCKRRKTRRKRSRKRRNDLQRSTCEQLEEARERKRENEELDYPVAPGKRKRKNGELDDLVAPGKRKRENGELDDPLAPGKRTRETEEADDPVAPGKRKRENGELDDPLAPGKRKRETGEPDDSVTLGKRKRENGELDETSDSEEGETKRRKI